MIARALVAQRAINDNEVRWRLNWCNLARRCHAEKKPAARCEQFFGDEDSERGANGATDDAVFAAFVMKPKKLSMVTCPTSMAIGAASGAQMPHDVPIWIENADFRDNGNRQTFLPSRLAQQALGCEG